MNKVVHSILAACLVLLMTASVTAMSSVEIKLENGTRWRGDVNDRIAITYKEQRVAIDLVGELVDVQDLYVVVRGVIAGEMQSKTIFRSDIVSIKSPGTSSAKSGKASDIARPRSNPKSKRHHESDASATKDIPRDDQGNEIGVFVLPMRGGVGQEFRHNEIEMLGKHADEYGPGQTIVLIIDSNGGLVLESELIGEAIFDIKKRHRVVAWVHKAISAGCMTAMCCDEIYFMTEGLAGSVTTITGGGPGGPVAIQGAEAEDHVRRFADLAMRSDYSEHMARAMKLNKYMCSYDKDPDTGEVTWYGDLSGEFDLSNSEQNLCFNASNALHSGFSKGTADTEEELAKMLDMPSWHEKSDYGLKISEDWQRTYKRATTEIPRILTRMSMGGGGGAEQVIGRRISNMKKLIKWCDRAELVTMMQGLEKEALEREIRSLQKQIADIRRARRRR